MTYWTHSHAQLLLGAPEDPQARRHDGRGEAGEEAPLLLRTLPKELRIQERYGKQHHHSVNLAEFQLRNRNLLWRLC